MIWIFAAIAGIYSLICLSYIFFQQKFIFHPQRLPKQYPYKCDMEFDELDLATPDRKSISAVLINPQSTKGIVVYYHGNKGNLTNYIPYAKKFWDVGYAVLMMDYRSFGKSTGKLSEKDFFDDAEIAYQNALQHFEPDKIILYGRSMGSAAATYVASRNNCKHLILEAPFYNLYDLARRLWMLLPTGEYLKFNFRNDLHLQSVKATVTIFHGTKDRIVPFRSGRNLSKFLKNGDEFVELKGGAHSSLSNFDQYNEKIQTIIA